VIAARDAGSPGPDLPESLLLNKLDNTWHDTAEAVINNWIGKVYQITNQDRRLPFMAGLDPDDPLGLRR
jgi:homoserine O-succinyltransferase